MPRAVLPPKVREHAAAHVEMLARWRSIDIVIDREGPHEAFWTTKHIVIPPIESALDYMIALHEIGHLLSNWSRRTWDTEDAEPELVNEGAAWGWAAAAADPYVVKYLTTDQKASIFAMFGSYVLWWADKPHEIGQLGRIAKAVAQRKSRRQRRVPLVLP